MQKINVICCECKRKVNGIFECYYVTPDEQNYICKDCGSPEAYIIKPKERLEPI